MKYLLSMFLLLALSTTVTSLAGISFPMDAGTDPDFLNALDCIAKQKKYSYASPIIISSSEGIDEGNVTAIVKTRAYFRNLTLVFFGCGSRSVESLVQELMKKVPKSLYDELYILPYQYFYQQCQPMKQKQKNCNRLALMLAQFNKYGVRPGIFMNQQEWDDQFGPSCTGFEKYPLYWQSFDNVPSFDTFVPFGGWAKPTLKLCDVDAEDCGISINLSYKQ